MARRWLAPWKDSRARPALYHCVSRVVDRRLVFGEEEKGVFVRLMRRMEGFSGCRVLAHCVMGNHFHLLLEVPPPPEGGVSDEELLKRITSLYGSGRANEVERQLKEARQSDGPPGATGEAAAAARARADRRAEEVKDRYTYRMHDLSEFMKTLLQRFTVWFNRGHDRTGNLWEDAFRSVILEDGIAARAVTAYIHLNPVRAGIVENPADYRWSSWAEAVRGEPKARAGLLRVWRAGRQDVQVPSHGEGALAWREFSSRHAAMLAEAVRGRSPTADSGSQGMPHLQGMVSILMRRLRHFTAGVAVGGRAFVEEIFEKRRERFGPRRKTGARKPKGAAAAAAGVLWTLRDLQKDVGEPPAPEFHASSSIDP